MSAAEAMMPWLRPEVYLRQTGRQYLTPRQRRRAQKKWRQFDVRRKAAS